MKQAGLHFKAQLILCQTFIIQALYFMFVLNGASSIVLLGDHCNIWCFFVIFHIKTEH